MSNVPTICIDNTYPKSIEEILAGLENPDREREPTFDWDENWCYRALGALLHDEALFKQSVSYIKPAYFPKSFPKIWKIAIELYNKHNALPSFDAMCHEIRLRYPLDDGMAAGLQSELRTIEDCFQPSFFDREYVANELETFAKTQQLKYSYAEIATTLKQAKVQRKTPDWEAVNSTVTAFNKVGANKIQSGWLDVLDEDFTLGENRESIIDDFISRGDLMVWAAKSKAGKSVVLSYMLNKLFSGETFLGGKCQINDLPVLYLDFENPRTFFRDWYVKCLTEESKARTPRQLMFKTKSVRPDGLGTLPLFLSRDWLEREIEAIEQQRHFKQPGLIVVDTFRGAFTCKPGLDANFECQAGSVGALLRPLQEFCHCSGWAMIMLHHTNKLGGVSGSTDFWAAADIVCKQDRDVDNNNPENTFSLNGRFAKAIPQRILRMEDNQFVYRGTKEEYGQWLSGLSSVEYQFKVASKVVDYLFAANEPLSKTALQQAMTDFTDKGTNWRLDMIGLLIDKQIIKTEQGIKNSTLCTVDDMTAIRLQQWKQEFMTNPRTK